MGKTSDKKFVEEITSMEVDFAQWYTDVVKKADLTGYTQVKGFMVIKPYLPDSGRSSAEGERPCRRLCAGGCLGDVRRRAGA